MRRRNAPKRRGGSDGSFWLSFSDLMSTLVLIFILIMFYSMYQYFDMFEVKEAELARRQFDLDSANEQLAEEQEKLTAAEQAMIAQQIKLQAAEAGLAETEDILAKQQQELDAAKALLGEKESQLGNLSDQLTRQQEALENQQLQLDVLFGKTWASAARVGTVQVGSTYFSRYRLRIEVAEAGDWELAIQSPDSGWDGCTFLDNFEMVRVAEPTRETVCAIPNGSFDRLVRPVDGGSATIANPWIHGRLSTLNKAEGWTFEINRSDTAGQALTNGVIGVVTTGTSAKKSNFMQIFPLSEATLGGGALAFVSTGGVASTSFSVPAGTWRLRGGVQRWATYWSYDGRGDTYMQGSPSIRATVVRGDGTATDLGVVQQTTQNLDTRVWPTAFTASGDETVTLRLEQAAGGVSAIGIVDNLELVRDDTRADNLVQDPGFERWDGFWDRELLPSPHTGRMMAYAWAGRYGNASQPQYWGYCNYEGSARLRLQNACVAFQDVAVPAAGRYRFKMHVRARADGSYYANNPVRVWLARGGVTNVLATTPTLFSRNWMEVSYLADVPEAGTWRLGLEGRSRPDVDEREASGGGRADQDAHIDGVSLVRCTDVVDAAPSLPAGLRIDVAKGAQLLLDYSGTAKCGPVTYDGNLYFGTIDAATHPEFVTGPGALEAISPGTIAIFR